MASAVQIGNVLLDCAQEALSASGRSTPGRVTFQAGPGVWDECDCAGHLWVSLDRKYLVNPEVGFPSVQGGLSVPCLNPPAESAAVFTVGLARCWPTQKDLNPVPATTVTEAAEAIYTDGEVIFGGLACCLPALGVTSVLGDLTPVGPSGGCVAVEIKVTVEVDTVVRPD